MAIIQPQYFFTSDTHDKHKNIVNLCNRPFRDANGEPDIVAMRKTMLTNINKKVRPYDILIHAGDVALGDPYDFLDQIECQVIVCLGNHDLKKAFVNWEGKNFTHNIIRVCDSIDDLEIGGIPVHVYHYPVQSWNKAYKGGLHFHGHSHGNLHGDNSQRCDVGVDSWNFEPQSFDELWDYLKTQEPWHPVDHHNEKTND